MEELLAYVGLGAADRARLVGLHAKIAASFGAIADQFYAAVFANPASMLTAGPEQILRLHDSLIDFLGSYDARPDEKRARIAHTFVVLHGGRIDVAIPTER